LTPLQWISLLLLAIGITTSQVSVSSAAQFIAPLQGYLWSIASAFVSALAAIYTEWVMKRNSDSLYWQNMQLYSFGIVLNGMGLIIGDIRSIAGHSSLWPRHLFRGYNGVTFLLVANLAFSGLLVSWIMKYADSIVKEHPGYTDTEQAQEQLQPCKEGGKSTGSISTQSATRHCPLLSKGLMLILPYTQSNGTSWEFLVWDLRNALN
ncbi:hypothetical protein WJX84_000410, partial [Apatococcus fuscideae]